MVRYDGQGLQWRKRNNEDDIQEVKVIAVMVHDKVKNFVNTAKDQEKQHFGGKKSWHSEIIWNWWV